MAQNPFSAPSGGDTLTAGVPYTIEWRSATPGPVFLGLCYDNNLVVGNLTDSTSNDGLFSWTPEQALSEFNQGKNYFLVICDINGIGACSYTQNGRFSIFAPITSTLVMISTVSVPVTPVATSSPTTASIAAPTSTQTSSPNDSTGGLSTGIKVTIAVLIPVGVLSVLAIAVLLLRKHKRRQPTREIQPIYDDNNIKKFVTQLEPSEGARLELQDAERHAKTTSELPT